MIGRTLAGIYQVLELIDSGGFADVYRARDLRSNAVVAVKVLHAHFANDPPLLRRFIREAELARGLHDPHIVRVLDAGEDGGTYFIVMEFVQGQTLNQVLQTRGPLPVGEVIDIGAKALRALTAAHRLGIVHRDIKPQNLMLTADGQLKVMDFGIARQFVAGRTRTQTGMLLGTPQYMAPEQFQRDQAVPATDLYALAIVLYELLTGRPPFQGETPWATLDMHARLKPPPLGPLRPDVPRALDAAIQRALAKTPDARYASADEMRAALESSRPRAIPHRPAEPRPSLRRRWIPALLACTALILIALSTFPMLTRRGDLDPSRNQVSGVEDQPLSQASLPLRTVTTQMAKPSAVVAEAAATAEYTRTPDVISTTLSTPESRATQRPVEQTPNTATVLTPTTTQRVAPSPSADADPEAVWKIGAVLDISGAASSLGVPERDSLKLIESQINTQGGWPGPDNRRHPIQVIIYDNQSDETQSSIAFHRLIEEDHVAVLIGASQTNTTLAALRFVQDTQTPLISPAAGAQIVEPANARKWVFKTAPSDSLVVAALINHLLELGATKVALLSTNNSFGANGRAELERQAVAAGMTISINEGFNADDRDISAQIEHVRESDAQALVVWAIPPAASVLTKNAREAGLEIPIFFSPGIGNRAFVDLAGPAANGVVFPAGKLLVVESLAADDQQRSVLTMYVRDFEARFGPRSTYGGYAWDALMLALTAMHRAGTDRVWIRDELENIKNVAGVSGVFSLSPMDHNGLDQRAAIMIKIEDGRWLPANP